MVRKRAFSVQFVVLLLLFGLAAPAAAARDSISKRIDKILADADASRAFWGIQAVSLTSGKTIYEVNQDKLFTPASNTKLFTTAATLALIGPTYKFRTTVETLGTVDKHGRLTGDVSLVGRGDPNLSGRTLPYNLKTERKQPHIKVLEDLADQLVQKGVKYVDGDIIADDSYFAFERYGEGWSQDDLVWEWGAPVSALSINDNVMFVNILPADRVGERAFVGVDPFADYYQIDNRILSTPAGTGPRRIYINREPGSRTLTLWGTIPLDDPGASEGLAIEDPADFAAQLFRKLLERRGIVVYGKSRTRHTELANMSTFSVTSVASGGGMGAGMSNSPLVLASYESKPLYDDLRVINKVSQNLHAEIMLRLLGRERGTAGTIEGGLETMRGFLGQVGIGQNEFVFYDGSGLSRQNLVTPRAVVKLLKYVTEQPWAAAYRDTLPVGGLDGSLTERFKEVPVSGHVRAKTGSLGHVNALAGYAETMNGEKIAFSIMVNNHNLQGKRALEIIDKIVGALVDDVDLKAQKDKKKKK